jgi:hypothetical protein
LPQIVGVAFWILTSAAIYCWPTGGAPAPRNSETASADEDLLEQFFQGDDA